MDKEYYENNRRKLISALKEQKIQTDKAFILLKGSQTYPEYNADTNYYPIKYEENIQYLFGIRKEGVDAMIDLGQRKCYLIGDDPNPDDYFYSKYLNKEDALSIYGVDGFLYKSQLYGFLEKAQPEKIYIYKGIMSTSRRWSNYYDNKDISERFEDQIDADTLFPLLNTVRCLKSKEEQEKFKEICKISSDAHVYAMQACLPGMKEYQLGAIFKVN